MIVSIFFKRIFFCIYLPVVSYWRTITCLHWSVKIEKPYLYLKNYEMLKSEKNNQARNFLWKNKIYNNSNHTFASYSYSFDNNSRHEAPSWDIMSYDCCVQQNTQVLWEYMTFGLNWMQYGTCQKKMQQQLSNQSSREWVLKINNEKYVYYKKLNSSFSKSNQAPSKKFQIPLA